MVLLRRGVCKRTSDLLNLARTLAFDGAACQPQRPRPALDPSKTSLALPRVFRAVVSVGSDDATVKGPFTYCRVRRRKTGVFREIFIGYVRRR
jgi:hypothetical protein